VGELKTFGFETSFDFLIYYVLDRDWSKPTCKKSLNEVG
jgi:hypothetical protein